MNNIEQIRTLSEKYMTATASEAEEQELRSVVLAAESLPSDLQYLSEMFRAYDLAHSHEVGVKVPVRSTRLPRLAVSAVAVVALAVVMVSLLTRQQFHYTVDGVASNNRTEAILKIRQTMNRVDMKITNAENLLSSNVAKADIAGYMPANKSKK